MLLKRFFFFVIFVPIYLKSICRKLIFDRFICFKANVLFTSVLRLERLLFERFELCLNIFYVKFTDGRRPNRIVT